MTPSLRSIRWSIFLALPFLSGAGPSCLDLCSCAARTTQQKFDYADAVFVGEVVAVHPEPEYDRRGRLVSLPSSATVRPLFGWKGVPQAAVVLPSGSGRDCLPQFRVGERFLVFAQARNGTYTTSWCAGTIEASGRPGMLAITELGVPSAPADSTPR